MTGVQTCALPISGGSGPGPITCGDATCTAGAEVCCIGLGPGGGGDPSCVPTGECEEASLACSDAASCPGGEVCCVDFGGPMDINSSCAPECGGFPSVQLCASDAECLDGEPCQEVFGGFLVCGSFGPGGPP